MIARRTNAERVFIWNTSCLVMVEVSYPIQKRERNLKMPRLTFISGDETRTIANDTNHDGMATVSQESMEDLTRLTFNSTDHSITSTSRPNEYY